MKVAKMPLNKNQPSRLELYKAGKLEERLAERPPNAHVEEAISEENEAGFKLRPELIAIALLLIVMLVLTVTGGK